ncbi:uncharacterized protein [Mytilus edulis]|uniref:uncharacterized protein isoform X1 n=1 Tax=Mytilus edulis TaxID=6550 RepID=UPI0039F0D52B
MDIIGQLVLNIYSIALVNCFLLDDLTTVHIFVSPNGSDSNRGRDIWNPLRTIEKALLQIVEPGTKNKDVIIELRSGYYELQSTLKIKHTGPRRLTIRASRDQDVHITGGKRIPSSAFKRVTESMALQRLPSTSRNKVLQVRLSDVGVTNLGTITDYGYYIKRLAALEVFENNKPLTLAKHPNKGYININTTYSDKKSFTYDSDQPKQWHQENDVWAHGFWYWSWSDRAYKVQHLDPEKRNITLSKPPLYGIKKGHYDASALSKGGYSKQGGYFRFVNVMSELDEPGDYYVDRERGILYVWPSNSVPYKDSDKIYVSIAPTCIEISSSAANVVLEGFSIEACRQFGIIASSVSKITLSKLQIQNTGSYGINTRGSNIKINQCYIRNTDGGISISGGDRKTLTPSRNEVSDNVILNFGRVGYVGSDGISCGGVGNHIHHNILYRGSYTGIHWRENDHLFEYNHLSKMCLEASDCGGMMTGRDWAARGNIIRNNHFHNIKRLVPGADVRGIMLDDQFSSVIIENNVFHDNDVHVNIGGGRDNIVRQNIFFNTSQYSMQIDTRGHNGGGNTNVLIGNLNRLPYQNDLWSHRYPKLASIMSDNKPGDPEGNQITDNIFHSINKPHFHGQHKEEWFNVSENIYIPDESSFYAPLYGNFKPICLLKGFAAITSFHNPVLPIDVGPRYQIGPSSHKITKPALGYLSGVPPTPRPCILKSLDRTPVPIYLPDGSVPNSLYNVSKTGCWFSFDKCPNHSSYEKAKRPVSMPFYRNTKAEMVDNSGTNETICLNKVSEMRSKCGNGSSFAVIFGPTGAMTLGGDGCYFATYGCPRVKSMASGFIRDSWAEQHVNGAHDESACLSRALPQWRYCGSDPAYPLASIYKPTGHIRVAGKGCWIKPEKCPADNSLNHMFYDGFGAANLMTDDDIESCFSRAEYFWRQCGSHLEYKVTAYFRPVGKRHSYP